LLYGEKRANIQELVTGLEDEPRGNPSHSQRIQGGGRDMAVDDSIVSEIVHLSDVAVRTASQIRLAQSRAAATDWRVLDRASEFVSRARQGVIFMNGGSADLHDTLRPLNWATDAYLALGSEEADFRQISSYLDQVSSALADVREKWSAAPRKSIRLALTFFEKLGDMLGAEADKLLRDDTDLVSLMLS
jgi:hypothetical protein